MYEDKWWPGYLAGASAGLVAGAVGHPLDTVKIAMQLDNTSRTLGATLRRVTHKEPRCLEPARASRASSQPALQAARHRTLMHGLNAALGSQLVATSLLFGTHDQLRSALGATPCSSSIAGALAGVLIAPATHVEPAPCTKRHAWFTCAFFIIFF